MGYKRSKGMAESGKTVNRLSIKQIYALCGYLEELQPTFDTQTTKESLAVKASEYFQISINQNNITTALETAEIDLPKAPKTESQKLGILKRGIETLYASLGIQLPPEWSDL